MNEIEQQKQKDLEICKDLWMQFVNSRKMFLTFAKQIAEMYCEFSVGDIVKSNNGFTYKITEIKGYACDSETLIGVEIKGIKINKKTLIPTYSSYVSDVKLYKDDITKCNISND